MARKSKAAKSKYSKLDKPGNWRNHDTYGEGVSYNRIVTRSQTAFLRVKNTISDLDLFSDPTRHQPPGELHLMETMKGIYGSIPRTVITRSTGGDMPVSEDLCKKLGTYKKYKPTEEDVALAREQGLLPPGKEEPKPRKSFLERARDMVTPASRKSSKEEAAIKSSSKEAVDGTAAETAVKSPEESAEKNATNETTPKESPGEVLPPSPHADYDISKEAIDSDI